MPQSGYTAQTFIAGEVPTTTIWNLLWSNDASFNSGNGFNDGVIIPRHFGSAITYQEANGWQVYDYGSVKFYLKRFTWSQTYSGATVLSLTPANGIAATSLPSGMSTLGTNRIQGGMVVNGNAYSLSWNFEMAPSNTTINVTCASFNGSSFTQSGFLEVMISAP